MSGDLLNGLGQGLQLFGQGAEICDPESKIIDCAGSALHLPKPLTDIAKIGVGVFTCDYLAVASGGADLVGGAMKQQAAQTEYPCNHAAQSCNGYSGGTYVAPPPPAGVSRGTYVAPPPPGHCAPRHVSHAPPPSPYSYGNPQGPAPLWSPSPANGCQAAGQSALDPNISEYQRSLDILQANFDTFANAKTGSSDGCGADKGLITRDKLAAINNDRSASPQMHEAAQFLLQHPEYFNRLDVAAGIGGHDGRIAKCDVDADVKKVKGQVAQYGNETLPAGTAQPTSFAAPQTTSNGNYAPPPMDPTQGSSSSSDGSSGFGSFLNDPGMDIDTKVQMLLANAEDNMDGAIDGVANQIATQSNQMAGITGTDAQSQSQRQQMQTSMQQLQMQLQDMMQRRSELFQLQSNLMDKTHQDGMTAINNIKS